MNTMSFYEFRSEKKAQALEVTFSRKTKSYHSNLFQQYIKNLSE